MRVLHVYRTFFPDTQGGLEEVIRQICAATNDLGAETRVFTTTKASHPSKYAKVDNTTVVRVKETFEIASCNVALNAFQAFQEQVEWADVIHYHYPWPFADLLNIAAKHRKPAIITYHSDIVRQRTLLQIYKPLMRHFLRSADRIVCTSPNYFATSTALSEFEHKVDVIPIGLDRTTYPEVSSDTLALAEQTYGREFFLFVGVLRYYKGLHILLEAIKAAPFNVVIVGSGPTEEQLKQQAKRLGLANVVFTGQVDNEMKVCLIKLSRAIVFPSYLRSEAFGVTLLEGAMYGKPLISTEVGTGTSHANVHDETGIVVTPGSPRSLRRAMDQLYQRPDMAKLMGKRAHLRFNRLFTGKLMGVRYWDLYCDLTRKNSSSSPNVHIAESA